MMHRRQRRQSSRKKPTKNPASNSPCPPTPSVTLTATHSATPLPLLTVKPCRNGCIPRILILDEATSALDYESERAIMENMDAICHNRTVLIIAHRLSTVRRAHRIIAMDKGRIIEEGSHEELLRRKDGYYRYLYQLQNG